MSIELRNPRTGALLAAAATARDAYRAYRTGQQIGNYIRGGYHRIRDYLTTSRMPPRRRYTRRPRAMGRRRRRVSRRPKKLRARRAYGRGNTRSTGTARVQRMRRMRLYRSLNTNMTRNDYDSFRVRAGFLPRYVNATDCETAVYNINLANLTDGSDFGGASGWLANEIQKWGEYKVANLQWVIEPINLLNHAQRFETDGGLMPFAYYSQPVRAPNVTGTGMTNSDFLSLSNTPGYRRFHILRQRQLVVNAKPIVVREDQIDDTATGTNILEESYETMGWQFNPSSSVPMPAASYPSFARFNLILPRKGSAADVGTPGFAVSFYCTIYLRGRRDFAEPVPE